MCDSVVIASPGAPIWVAKNSDRAPDEVQLVDWVPAAVHPAGEEVRCTAMTIPQVPRTHALILSRPRWMWGCEMGINAAGVAVANEAAIVAHLGHRRELTPRFLDHLWRPTERNSDWSWRWQAAAVLRCLAGRPGAEPHRLWKR